jgi:hypothetical protein
MFPSSGSLGTKPGDDRGYLMPPALRARCKITPPLPAFAVAKSRAELSAGHLEMVAAF